MYKLSNQCMCVCITDLSVSPHAVKRTHAEECWTFSVGFFTGLRCEKVYTVLYTYIGIFPAM